MAIPVVPVHEIETSSSCPQLCFASPPCLQSARLVSDPTHRKSSSQISPSPGPYWLDNDRPEFLFSTAKRYRWDKKIRWESTLETIFSRMSPQVKDLSYLERIYEWRRPIKDLHEGQGVSSLKRLKKGIDIYIPSLTGKPWPAPSSGLQFEVAYRPAVTQLIN